MLDTKEINSIKNKLLEEDTIIDIAELFKVFAEVLSQPFLTSLEY